MEPTDLRPTSVVEDPAALLAGHVVWDYDPEDEGWYRATWRNTFVYLRLNNYPEENLLSLWLGNWQWLELQSPPSNWSFERSAEGWPTRPRHSRAIVQSTLAELADLLEPVETWARTLRGLSESCATEPLGDTARRVLALYGGAGSFTDVVLSRGNEIDADADDHLDLLRRRLFQLAVDLIE